MISETKQTKLFIDLKHTVIEKSYSDEKHVFTKFFTCFLKDLCLAQNTPSHTLNLVLAAIHDYIDFSFQKSSKSILYKSYLPDIIHEFINHVKLLDPTDAHLDDLKQNNYKGLIHRHIHILQELFTIQKDSKSYIKRLFEDPSLDMKFFYHTKYLLKKQIIRNLIETELLDLTGYYGFDKVSSDDPAYIVTTDPSCIQNNKNHQLIYYSCLKINIFQKLKFEEKLYLYPQKAEISCLSQLPGTITFLREITSQDNPKSIRIGYAFDDLKFRKLQAKGDVVSSKYPVEMIPIDLRIPLNRNIDGFLHRVFGLTKNENDPFSSVIMHNFQKLTEQPNLQIFDPMDSIDLIQSREAFQLRTQEIFQSKKFLDTVIPSLYKFDVPKACHIDPKTLNPEKVISLIKSQNIKFPLVVKTTDACLDQSCHQMCVVLNEEGLLEVENSEKFRTRTHILQEYINHDERIFKIYMIGDHFAIQQKQSLPNLSNKLVPQNCLSFHSQASFKDLPEFKQLCKGFEPFEIDMQMVKAMCTELGKELKLSIIGLDLIKETDADIYYLIDINYFPGFKGFKDLRSILHSHFIEKCCKN